MHDDDIRALFRGHREASLEKREKNRAASTKMLVDRGIFFVTHNEGVHLIVAERWDFWPGTGKWRERRGTPSRRPREGRGVHKLLTLIEEDQKCSQP